MKVTRSKYPRVFSLSTLGIKQHFNCDYLIHSKRTDFSGDSGSGKSMVADLLQLILVGSTVFKSSTTGNDIRDPKGMVMDQQGRKSGKGYAFLNIEIARKRYIVIGVYIESSHNKVQPFVVQSGYDWVSQLQPLEKPLLYSDLVLEGKIWPVNELKERMTLHQVKTFKWKQYHGLLYEQELIGLELASEKTLESYASIMRSFSRGKGFKTDSSSLKDFLFGSKEEKLLWEKYQSDVVN